MPESKAMIVMRSGPIPGSSYYIEKDEVLLGRDLANDIPVPDPEISRRHARFITRPEGVYVEDLGSTNGTFVNGARLSAPQLLKNGDLITLAEGTVMSFEQAGTAPHEVPVYAAPEAVYPQEVAAQSTIPPTTTYAPVEQPVPQRPLAPAPSVEKPKKKMGWCSVLLIILLISLIVIALVVTFMPASWWCALTFNSLAGCPVQ